VRPADPAAGGGGPPPGLAAALDRAARASSRVASVGVHVRDAESGTEVFGRRAGEPFVLASNTKILTTAAALEVLGPGAFLETGLRLRGTVAGGVLTGDLAVVGGGDPLFSWRLPGGDPYAVFRGWAATLRRRGVERVAGDLYLDHGLFGDPNRNPDWDPDKYLKWYQVPVDALTFNENVVRVRALPGERSGAPARVSTVPPLDGYFQLEGDVRTVPSWRGNQLRVFRPVGSEALRVSGGVYLRASDLEMPISVHDPATFFGAALAAALAEEGVVLEGALRPVAALPGLVWESVATHRTPVWQVVGITNRESHNLFAESLVKLIGVRRCGVGTWERGMEAVEELVAETAGIPRERFSLTDGSGLSRRNRMAPADMTRFLVAIRGEPWYRHLVASLPTGGQEGTTLEERLEEFAGRFRAKTGTLEGVTTLSGYARGRSGRLYAFSVLARGGVGASRKVQEEVVEALVERG
jgi:D-alanyl-D-alanine carboxypeptidase/D-alanyl-D-alanine-endopeptidase (penicillin-binding protein 4)